MPWMSSHGSSRRVESRLPWPLVVRAPCTEPRRVQTKSRGAHVLQELRDLYREMFVVGHQPRFDWDEQGLCRVEVSRKMEAGRPYLPPESTIPIACRSRVSTSFRPSRFC